MEGIVGKMLIFRNLGAILLQYCNGLLYAQGIFDSEYAAAASLEGVEMRSGAKGFTKVTGECSDIGAFAAGHPDDGTWKAQSGVVSDVYSA